VAADVLWRGPTGGDEAVDAGVGVDAALAADRKRLVRVVIDDVQQLQDPPVGSLVEPEVERPTRGVGLHPAVLRAATVLVASETSGTSNAVGEHPVRLAQLATIWSGCDVWASPRGSSSRP
jgi:hypothetical protein